MRRFTWLMVLSIMLVVWTKGAYALTPHQVFVVQLCLAKLGYPPGPVDGQMHPETQRALIDYAIDHGLAGQELALHLARECRLRGISPDVLPPWRG